MQPAVRSLLLVALLAALTLAACGGGEAPEGRAPESLAAPAGEAERDREERAPVLRGGERIVFIGDSLALQAPPSYPELLPAVLGERAPGVETINLAEPGTTAADWRPGSPLFEQRLDPELGQADLIVVSLGGNDLEAGIGAADGIDALSKASDRATAAFDAIDRFGRQLRRIHAEIRERAPDAGIVYVGYPDYAAATTWQQAAGAGGTLALELGLDALFAAAAGAEPDLLVDMRAATERAGVDSLLADGEYLAPAGHELYARRLARELTKPQPVGDAG
jgi:lysophospholipase L1-like esterase